MGPPTPDTCSSVRAAWADHETYTTPVAVLTNEPCLFAPASSNIEWGFMGPVGTQDDLLFIGSGADIERGDELTNDATSEVWVVVEPPRLFKNPITWVNDHYQVKVERKPIQ